MPALSHSLDTIRLRSPGFSVAWRLLVSAWVLAYFLLPNTIWERFSPGAILLHHGMNAPPVALAIALLALCGSIVYFIAHRETSTQEMGVALPFWLLIALYYIPSVVTLFVYQGRIILLEDVSSLLVALSCGFLCAILCGETNKTVLLICLFGLVQGVFVVLYHRLGINVVASNGLLRAGGTFANPSAVYTLMMLGLPLAVAQAFKSVEVYRKAFWMLCASVMFAALILTWDWVSMLAVAVALTWVVAHHVRDKYFVIGLGAFLLCGVALVAQFGMGGPVHKAHPQIPTTETFLPWHQGIVIFENNWLEGTGIGVLSIPVEVGTGVPGIKPAAVHVAPPNLFLLWLEELGIAGGVLFVVVAQLGLNG